MSGGSGRQMGRIRAANIAGRMRDIIVYKTASMYTKRQKCAECCVLWSVVTGSMLCEVLHTYICLYLLIYYSYRDIVQLNAIRLSSGHIFIQRNTMLEESGVAHSYLQVMRAHFLYSFWLNRAHRHMAESQTLSRNTYLSLYQVLLVKHLKWTLGWW